jgi:hypothetical protein
MKKHMAKNKTATPLSVPKWMRMGSFLALAFIILHHPVQPMQPTRIITQFT